MISNQLSTALPEEMGIPTKAIEHLIHRLKNQGIPLHSLLIARHNSLVFEGYYAPYTANTLHRMFSVTKSLVSLAIGAMEAEGLIGLDDSICTYFPTYLPIEPHPWLLTMTIRDMLQMKSCHSGTTYDKLSQTEHWVKSFFTTAPSHPAGSVFLYDTSASHTLCALVEKLTGKTLMDYLRQQFLDEIGFSKEAYILSDPFGTSMGGSGLMALPSDLMRLGLLLINQGKWNHGDEGKQLYPQAYVKLATAISSATIMNGPILEEQNGYGYQFWILSHGGYGCYGMGGQLLLCYPDKDLVCVVTADTQGIQGGNQAIYNGIYHELFPYLSEKPLPYLPEQGEALNLYKKTLTLPVLNQITELPNPNRFTRSPYFFMENPAGFTCFDIKVEHERKWVLTMCRKGRTEHCPFGFGHLEQGVIGQKHMAYAASGSWIDKGLLYIHFWLIDICTGSIQIQIDFSKGPIMVYMKKTEETLFDEFQGFLNEKTD